MCDCGKVSFNNISPRNMRGCEFTITGLGCNVQPGSDVFSWKYNWWCDPISGYQEGPCVWAEKAQVYNISNPDNWILVSSVCREWTADCETHFGQDSGSIQTNISGVTGNYHAFFWLYNSSCANLLGLKGNCDETFVVS